MTWTAEWFECWDRNGQPGDLIPLVDKFDDNGVKFQTDLKMFITCLHSEPQIHRMYSHLHI
jgi:hypothetical protein